MQLNDSISIVLACGRNAVSNTMVIAAIRGEVIETTVKAVKVQAMTNGRDPKVVSAWFPRTALRQVGDIHPITGSNRQHRITELARWFHPKGWTARFIDITQGI